MYDTHPDPYAGQYPKPPPPPESLSTATPGSTYYPQQQYFPEQQAWSDYRQPSHQEYHQPATQEYHRPSHDFQYHTPAPQDYQRPSQDYQQPSTQNYHPTPASQDYYHRQSYDPATYYPHPNTNYYTEELDAPSSPNTPIIPKPETTPPKDEEEEPKPKKKAGGWFKKAKVESTPPPPPAAPQPAPEDEKPTYAPPNDPERAGGGFNCCCYNPEMTCCNFFCMLIAIGFLAGGIALMVASKIVNDRCNNECGGSAEETLSNCTVLCNTVLHKALLYGGAAVTGLAGLAVVWRLVMCCCAGFSRK
ncbi:hypothetical protein BJV82DRAFT_617089 [Fennellomyces sp. T-0311]|nr:hypothetical protein BJV82DRAFT_617089 [Fennellomyces sp. T-0311]